MNLSAPRLKAQGLLYHLCSILPVPNNLIFQAAEYRAQYALSYADCFALVSAVEYKATLVTGDPEFKKVEHLVDIVWI